VTAPQNRANAGQFKKGQSGNPGGRVKVDPDVKEALKAACPRAAERLVELMESPDEAVAMKAAATILDRVHGKPAQSLILGNEGKRPFSITITPKRAK
jgi:hypothetical protein